MLQTKKILGVSVTNESANKISEYVLSGVKNGGKKLFIITPNPEILVRANSHLDYKDKLNSSDVALPDGIGLFWAARLLGEPLQERISGVDFVEKLCSDSRNQKFGNGEKPLSIGLLGGRKGVAEAAADRLKKKYPWLTITFVGEEWSSAGGPVGHHPPPTSSVSSSARPAGARWGPPMPATPYSLENPIDILFVAFGHPKQEEWIYENLSKLPVKAAMGVGGSFDYLSGRVVRAPKVLRILGLEWLFRLIRQPWRLKRQLSLLTFIKLVLQERRKSR